jgi:D-beta-D-heptose 7-phosphate kinase/D-beta-D-heptose 1-phosphate adenosyltransferase
MHIDISIFSRCHILVVGDLMIDEYMWGNVSRISPEAPVPVVSIETEELRLGGSGNVVNNLVALGASVAAVGVIGGGGNGQFLLAKLKELGVNAQGIITAPDRPTTKKTRIIADHQHVLRIDRENKSKMPDSTFDKVIRAAVKIIPEVDVVLISDYGKGLITGSLVSRMTETAKKHGKITIADPKGLDFRKYSGTNIITPNRKEASAAAGIEIVDDASLFEAGKRILQITGVDKLVITCGQDGMVYFVPGAKPCKIGTKAHQVYDVSGAGDTVLALLGLAIASDMPFEQGVTMANTAAGIVVGKIGTATVSAPELAAALKRVPTDVGSKQIGFDELTDLARRLKARGKRIVLTNGCFDLLHVGHIRLLTASRQMGDVLIVALDDDDSVKRLKGPQRPVIRSGERVRIISALDSVDYVVVFSSGDLDQVIDAVRPDVLTKGSNYGSDNVSGRSLVERHGGRVELIPITDDISSTRLINSIKNN